MDLGILGIRRCREVMGKTQKCMHNLAALTLPPGANTMQIDTVWL